MTDTITLTSPRDGFAFSALHAAPDGRRRGGIVLVAEIFGIDAAMQADTARWAALGFEVVTPSLFDRQKPGFVGGRDPEAMKESFGYMTANGLENPLGDAQACIDYLAPRGPVFMAGYCYGGTIAWLGAARLHGLAAASSYYGRLADHAASTPKIPVICHFGRNDGHIPADPTKAAILAANPQVPVYIYENSGHGFNNEGPGADPSDAALARRRTLDLFEANGAG